MASNSLRTRYSVRELEAMYDAGNKKPLEDVMRAWKGIKEKPHGDHYSFFTIAGYHGEPFHTSSPDYWGGYCHHGDVLFPLWHRAYLHRLEQALRSVPGCEDVTQPYWDETSDASKANGIPRSLTQDTFMLDGHLIPNPLKSYTIPVELEDKLVSDKNMYKKPAGYQTVRYPLSGIVGTEEYQQITDAHNAQYNDPVENLQLLNENVKAWINRGAPVDKDGKSVIVPNSEDVFHRYEDCLKVESYTLFSNTTSAGNAQGTVVPLESPHNVVHLSVGGFDASAFGGGKYESGFVAGANGDMGENNTAAFDPIFFFHHCNVDRMFWVWQTIHGKTNNFVIDESDPGASTTQPDNPPPFGTNTNEKLSLDTPLKPFPKGSDGGQYLTGNDCINIENQLGFTYSQGSLADTTMESMLSAMSPEPKTTKYLHVSAINRADIPGSFVVKAYAEVDHKLIFLGLQPFLSRWNVKACAKCRDHIEVHSDFPLNRLSKDEISRAKYKVVIEARGHADLKKQNYKIEVLDSAV